MNSPWHNLMKSLFEVISCIFTFLIQSILKGSNVIFPYSYYFNDNIFFSTLNHIFDNHFIHILLLFTNLQCYILNRYNHSYVDLSLNWAHHLTLNPYFICLCVLYVFYITNKILLIIYINQCTLCFEPMLESPIWLYI